MSTPTIDPRTATFQRLLENYCRAQGDRRAAAHELRRIARHTRKDARATRREARAAANLTQAEDQLIHAAAQILSARGRIEHGLHQVTVFDARGRTRPTLAV